MTGPGGRGARGGDDGRGERGRKAEALVAQRLVAEGFEILARNAREGRLELDIVARRGDLLVVVEVRSRSSDRFGSPVETIGPGKVKRIRAATARWLASHRPGTRELRFDAAAVTFDGPHGAPRIEYYEDAF